MRPWLAAHRHALRAALADFARRPVASLFEAAVFGIALALPLAFVLAVENVRVLGERHPATPEISVYLTLDANADEIKDLAERLGRIDQAEAVRFISRAEAAKRLRRSAALADVLDALPTNPLPDAFLFRIRAADAGRLEAVRREIAAWPQVARVQVDSEWAQKLDALVQTGRIAAGALGLMLGLAMIAIIFNTVRLQMLRAREEIELSRLIGATDAFVRRPYLYCGVLLGFFGAAFALVLVGMAHHRAGYELTSLSVTYGAMLELRPWPGELPAAVLGLGALLGWLAARLCVARAPRAQ